MSRTDGFADDSNRSWTDIFSNHTFIDGLEDLSVREFSEGNLPLDALPHFLHEATHFLSFTSPVGIALAILEHKTRLAVTSTSSNVALRAAEFHFRTITVLSLLRPLFEGFALFSEFDALPSSSRLMTTQSSLILFLFLQHELKTSDEAQISQYLFTFLTRIRGSEVVVGRKAELLSSPFSSSEGYLSGYLYMKGFSVYAAKTAPQFLDTDLCLGFASHHFLFDYELVYRLLKDPVVGSDIATDANELKRYIGHRLRNFFLLRNLSDLATQYEEQMLASDNVRFDEPTSIFTPALDNDIGRAEEHKSLLDEAINDLPEDVRSQIARRRLLHIASIPAKVEVANGQFKASTNREILYGPVSPKISANLSAEGSIDLLYDIGFLARVIAINSGGTCIGCHVAGQEESEFVNQISTYNLSRKHIIFSSDSQATALNSIICEQGWSKLRDDIRSGLEKTQIEIFRILALWWLPEDRRKNFVEIVAENGLLSIFSERLLKTVSMLSMLDNAAFYLEEIALPKENGNISKDFDEIQTIFERHFGESPFMRLVESDDGPNRTRVVSLI